MNSRPLLLVFLRAPVLGKVKTRLAATLGKERALVIYKRLLQHTIELLDSLRWPMFARPK